MIHFECNRCRYQCAQLTELREHWGTVHVTVAPTPRGGRKASDLLPLRGSRQDGTPHADHLPDLPRWGAAVGWVVLTIGWAVAVGAATGVYL